MSKSKSFITCPHCNEKINLSKISKASRKHDSTDFFDIDSQTQEDINIALQNKNIEFGTISKRKEDD